jgi:hypothetical protein
MQEAYLGPTCLALGAGSGVSLVTFRNELLVFYPLNLTPIFVGADCAAVVTVGQSLGMYISPESRFSFSLAAPPFAMASFRGYVLDAGGCVGCGGNVSEIVVGGYPVGALLGQTAWCRWWGCSISTGWTETRRSCWRLGLLKLGFRCRLTWGWGAGWRMG